MQVLLNTLQHRALPLWVSAFVSQLSRITFYGCVSSSGCLDPKNKIHWVLFSPTNPNSKYLQSISGFEQFWLKLKGVVYLQIMAELDCEAKSFSPCSTKNLCWILAGQFGCIWLCLVLSPFRTCGGISLVSLLSVTLGLTGDFFLAVFFFFG